MGHPHPRHPSNVPKGDPKTMPANDLYRDGYDAINWDSAKPCGDKCVCDDCVAEMEE